MPSSPVSSSGTSQLDGKGGSRAESIGFWHRDLAPKRNKALLRWLAMTLFLGFAVLAFLSLYWGSLFHLYDKYSTLTVIVVDFDGTAPYLDTDPIVGPLVVEILKEQIKKPGPHLGYRVMSPVDFNNDPLEVRRNIYHQKNWAAVVVNANATALLKQALETGNKTYDPKGAGQIVFVEARQEAIVDEYILPELQMMQDEIMATFGARWISQIVGNLSDSSIRKNIEMAPQVLNPAIGFTSFNLRPFDIPVATPSTSVGLIYLVIFSFFSFPFFAPVHGIFLAPGKNRPLKFSNFIIWRIIASITTFLFLSLCYSLVSLSFGVPFSRPPGSHTDVAHSSAYGRGGFVVYWMLNWVGMTSFGLPSENMCMLLGFPWFSLWLIFWVICNVCVSFYFVPLSPGFYKYGYAWPMHNIVEASRTIIFDVHSRVGLNFGVLFAWCAVSILVFPVCAGVARRRMVKGKVEEKVEEEEEIGEGERDEGVSYSAPVRRFADA